MEMDISMTTVFGSIACILASVALFSTVRVLVKSNFITKTPHEHL